MCRAFQPGISFINTGEYIDMFFKSIFSNKGNTPGEAENRSREKDFDVLKYDGMRAQRMHGKLPYAIKCFTEALNIREDAETRTHLAAAYLSAGKTADALEQIDRLVELQPDNAETRLMRIQILFLLDRDSEVVADCRHILSLDSANYQAYYQMAKAKRATGDLFGAIADLTKGIAIKDDFAGAYQLRAEILLSMQQGADALGDIEKVISLNPEEETAYLLRGKIYELVGEPEKAAADFKCAVELNPFNAEAYILQSRLFLAEGKTSDAIEVLDEAIETLPDNAGLYAERGRIRNLAGDKDGAFEDAKKSIELNPQGEMAQQCNGEHSNIGGIHTGGIY